MNKWLKVGTLAALVAVMGLVALGAGAAFAQGPTATPPAGGLGLHLGGPQNSLVSIAAETLKMSVTDLVAQLNQGTTLAEIAKSKNVDPQKIVDAMVANRTAALKAAVDAKRITQAQMDAELALMKTNITAQINNKWQPRGYGMGLGMGAGRGVMGQGYVDANKDGICDNCGAAGHPMGPGGRWGTK